MTLDNLIDKHVVSCPPTTPIREVATMMEAENVGAVLVCDTDGTPAGIITDRDIVVRCLVKGDGAGTLAADVMTPNPETVSEDDGIVDIIHTMKQAAVRRVPVVDRAGRAIGLVSFGDVFRLLGQELALLGENLTPETPKLTDAA